jgi:biotin transport system substrate-specific component
VAGLCAERGAGRNWLLVAASLVLADLVIYVPGVLWLGAFTGFGKAIALGFVPFVVGDVLKIAAGTGLLSGFGLVARRAQVGKA